MRTHGDENYFSTKDCQGFSPGDENYFSSPIVPFDDEYFVAKKK